MAKKISKADISDSDVFGGLRTSAENALKDVNNLNEGLKEIARELTQKVNIIGVGTTGSGRELIGMLIGSDTINDEITAHKTGALHISRGMLETDVPTGADKPLIAASMFGNTTQCVEDAKKILEAAGYEVLVFHATGSGGRTLEALAKDGVLAGVLDVTTTEIADELVGGVLSAGADRLTADQPTGVRHVLVNGTSIQEDGISLVHDLESRPGQRPVQLPHDE